MHKKVIILLSGKRYSGKDTVGECLQKLYPHCKIIALADLVRQEYITTNQLNVKPETLKKNSQIKETHRPGLITLAESRKQQQGLDYWSKQLYLKHIKSAISGIFVVTDWRFIEEFAFFSEQPDIKVVTVRIEASMETRKSRGFVFNQQTDEGRSEINLDHFPFDVSIINDNVSKQALTQIVRETFMNHIYVRKK